MKLLVSPLIGILVLLLIPNPTPGAFEFWEQGNLGENLRVVYGIGGELLTEYNGSSAPLLKSTSTEPPFFWHDRTDRDKFKWHLLFDTGSSWLPTGRNKLKCLFR